MLSLIWASSHSASVSQHRLASDPVVVSLVVRDHRLGLFVAKPSSWPLRRAYLRAGLLRVSVSVCGGPYRDEAIVTQLVTQ